MLRHRRCVVLRGERAETSALEKSVTAGLDDVLRVGWQEVPPTRVRHLLGQAFDAVVLDLHDGVDADVLGQSHGLVRGGGALILRMPPAGLVPPASFLAVSPYTAADVGTRFWTRLERCLAHSDAIAPAAPLERPPTRLQATKEQGYVVARLAEVLSDPVPSFSVLMADRGRGKSSALGLALRAALRHQRLRVAVTAWKREAASEVFRFAPAGPDGQLRFMQPLDVIRARSGFDVIVVDEAAQLPVALLREIALCHPAARIAFATTTHGYEGTGRGFVLRFLHWLDAQDRPVTRFSLIEPIRWDAGDPLERLVFDVLSLDAEATAIGGGLPRVAPARVLDRDELMRDDGLLRSLFGLLVHAHYRTAPSDLHRLLDAPNLAIHAIVHEGAVLAASLVAREGELERAACEAFAQGRRRVRGHALADTLMTHAGRPSAGRLSFIRSVRIATQPAHRRHGLAHRLVDHVHRSYAPDLFGTLFGATPELLCFRRTVGYELVRIGSSRGSRTGEPSALMLRARSPAGKALMAALRLDLARDLPLQLELLEAEGELGLDPRLAALLGAGLEPAIELEPAELQRRVERYLSGPQTAQAAAYVLQRFVEQARSRWGVLDVRERVLVEGRILARRDWGSVARAAGYPSVKAAMRALRPAIRKLHVDRLPAGKARRHRAAGL